MRKAWIWILVGGIVLIALLCAGALLVRGVFGTGGSVFLFGPRMLGPDIDRFRDPGGMPMMRPGFPGVGLLEGLILLLILGVPLGIFALLIVGLVLLLRRPAAYVAPAAAAGPVQVVDASAAAETRACPNCGRPVQTGWQVCPYCRQELA